MGCGSKIRWIYSLLRGHQDLEMGPKKYFISGMGKMCFYAHQNSDPCRPFSVHKTSWYYVHETAPKSLFGVFHGHENSVIFVVSSLIENNDNRIFVPK